MCTNCEMTKTETRGNACKQETKTNTRKPPSVGKIRNVVSPVGSNIIVNIV